MNKQVRIFGDSLMKGVILGEDNKYHIPKGVNVDAFAKEFYLDIFNHSSFGCTVTKGAGILSKALADGLDSDFVLLEYGGNDCDFNWAQVSAAPDEEHLPHTPIALFSDTLIAAVKQVSDRGIKPILMSLPPISADRYIDWICSSGLSKKNIIKWLGDTQMIYRFQELYSDTVAGIAHLYNCIFVDVRRAFLDKRNYCDLMCADGIHPNTRGQALIRQVFTDFFKNSDLLLPSLA